MPFPWKKVKSTRISQFVNDHLHNSQRRRDGSSLFVETGFPTSLVDLFIKNRQKLKKSSKKKPQIPPISPLRDDGNVPITAESPTPFPSPLPSPSPQIITRSHSPVHMHCPSPLRSPLHSTPSSVDRILVVDERDQIAETGVDANTVLLVVFKMFLVVILALGTKKLTVGITLSALLLFLLEYIGKHVGGLLKPLKLIVQSVRRLLRFKDVKLDGDKGVVLIPGCSSSLESYGSRSLDQEIQVVEPEDCFATRVQEIQPEGEVVDGSCFNARLEYREIKLQETSVVEEEKEEPVYKVAAEFKKKSRRAKIKSKMKNLFPKKSRKEHESQKHEDSASLCDESRKHEDSAWLCDEVAESESASESSSVSSRKYKEEDWMMSSTVYYSSGGFSEISEEVGVKRDEEIEGGLSWKYLILGVIVLVGLIGGKTFALLLTLSWLLLLKFSKTLPMCTNVVPTSTMSISYKKSV